MSNGLNSFSTPYKISEMTSHRPTLLASTFGFLVKGVLNHAGFLRLWEGHREF
jgi:hypothetical protein